MQTNICKKGGEQTSLSPNKGSANSRKIKRSLFYFSVVALPVLQFIIFYVVVNFRSILFAFQGYNADTGAWSWVGLQNFADFFGQLRTEPKFTHSLKNSTLAWACSLVIGTGGAVLFSNYIYKKYFLSKFFRITLFLPTILSGIVLVVAYKIFVSQGIPDIAKALGVPNFVNPFTKTDKWFVIMFVFWLWFSFGTQVLMYTSSMSGISVEIVEAAQVDGITPFKELIYITVPSVYNVIVTFITIGMAGYFTNSLMIYSFYGGIENGVLDDVYTFGYYLYVQSLQAGKYSMYDLYCDLSAIGLLMTAIAIPLTFGVKKLLEKFGPSEN